MAVQNDYPEQLDPKPWRDMPQELLISIVRFLPANEIALTGRLVNKATAAHFRGLQYCTVRLSQPTPPHDFAQRWGSPGVMRGLTLKQRRQLLCLTASSGSLPNLQVAATYAGCALTADVLGAAAAAGQLEACQWLRQQGCPWVHMRREALAAAAGAGQQPACEWLLAAGCLWSQEAVYAAAQGGHVGLMEWLLLHQPEGVDEVCSADLLKAAAKGCDLATLQRLYEDWRGEQLMEMVKWQILAAAASSPTPDWQDKVLWLEERGFTKRSSACAEAAACSDALSRLRWLRQQGYPLLRETVESAAARGNIAVLEYLRREDEQLVTYPITAKARASANGHLATVQWLDTCPDIGLHAAARGGHLELVSWLAERAGVRLGRGMFSNAATSGNLELLRWLRQHRCPGIRDQSNLSCAAEAGSEEMIEWLVEQGCPWGEDGSAYRNAARNGDLATLRCLGRLGCPWGSDQIFNTDFYLFGPLEVVRLLLELGCPVDWEEAVCKASRIVDVTHREGLLVLLHEQQALHQQQQQQERQQL
ncbi:hypothetical protein Agub_g3344 [Astrephomene gubernaculifera]|uniref:Uncharacterized protein n=1 Tax=Astrephomene gubernaculifera TaxID=47775 RepID=A0AAD3HIZ8_9CHLO|nr:hypothetical protein Agub_g3344 [Astrephomene gubernaculifera]